MAAPFKECLTHIHVVVWDGRELMPMAPQWMYQLQSHGRRTMLSLGLVRFGDGEGDLIRDADIDRDAIYLVPLWRKRRVRQRKAAAKTATLRRASEVSMWAQLTGVPDQVVPASHGSRHAATLTDREVLRLRAAYRNGDGSFALLGKRFGVSSSTVGMIVSRSTYKHLP